MEEHDRSAIAARVPHHELPKTYSHSTCHRHPPFSESQSHSRDATERTPIRERQRTPRLWNRGL